jgi:hypothetical protein
MHSINCKSAARLTNTAVTHNKVFLNIVDATAPSWLPFADVSRGNLKLLTYPATYIVQLEKSFGNRWAIALQALFPFVSFVAPHSCGLLHDSMAL